MNTMLMDAYESLEKIILARRNDPQEQVVQDALEHIWDAMGSDEVKILNSRREKRGQLPRLSLTE